MSGPMLQGRDAVWRALTTTVVPEAASLDERGWQELLAIVADAIAQRPARMQRQVRAFLQLVELLPLARYGRRFTRADGSTRARVLHALERAPIAKLRQGLWGVRTLVFMGYYARPEAQAQLGYTAQAGGWSARVAAQSAGTTL